MYFPFGRATWRMLNAPHWTPRMIYVRPKDAMLSTNDTRVRFVLFFLLLLLLLWLSLRHQTRELLWIEL